MFEPKTKMLVFINNNRILVKLFQNNNIIFNEKFQKTILFWVLVFNFMYMVSVYPTNRTFVLS